MLRLASAEWLRICKYWLPWVLLALQIVILVLQVNGKLDELPRLEAKVEAALSASGGEPLTPFERIAVESDRLEATRLRQNLCYPASKPRATRLWLGRSWARSC